MLRQWVREGRGVLFLPYQAEQIAALKALIATWMRLAIFQTMSLPEQDNRLWFVVDELDALGNIDGLKDALARIRKFGGRCVLGFQSIAQVSAVYGPGPAKTIVENCSSSLILRCSASEGGGTAQFASVLIGKREIIRQTVSTSTEARPILSDTLRGHTYGEQHQVEDAEGRASPMRRCQALQAQVSLGPLAGQAQTSRVYAAFTVTWKQ